MIAVGVGDEDMADPLARNGAAQGVQMLRQIGAGIDHRDVAVTDDINPGALEGERAGIARQKPRHARAEGDGFFIRRIERADERNSHASLYAPPTRFGQLAFLRLTPANRPPNVAAGQ